MPLRIEEVFKIQGVPTHTFVEPTQYAELIVALRSPGRGVVVEGPSGIGKSTAVDKALDEIGTELAVTHLSARKQKDLEYIGLLADLDRFGVVVVDDFHRLPNDMRSAVADLLKTLADEEDPQRKLVLIGINQAGYSLIQFGQDLGNRIDVIKFEAEPTQKIRDLVALGERALNVRLTAADQIVDASNGSFYIAQLLCHNACVQARQLQGHDGDNPVEVPTLYAEVRRAQMERLGLRFNDATRDFAKGTKFRPAGRAPYLQILRWLKDADSWSINLKEEMALHPSERISVGQVVDKGYLQALVDKPAFAELLHFDEHSKILSVEDPQYAYYLRNLDWADFVTSTGFTKVDFKQEYDVALSFAGEDREMAELMRDHLDDLGYAVFYDLAEQHRIVGNNVEAYLGPIYRSNSRFVLAVLGEKYGEKRWTMFEASEYRERLALGEVIPLKEASVPIGALDAINGIGLLTYDRTKDLRAQAASLCDTVAKKIDGA